MVNYVLYYFLLFIFCPLRMLHLICSANECSSFWHHSVQRHKQKQRYNYQSGSSAKTNWRDEVESEGDGSLCTATVCVKVFISVGRRGKLPGREREVNACAMCSSLNTLCKLKSFVFRYSDINTRYKMHSVAGHWFYSWSLHYFTWAVR